MGKSSLEIVKGKRLARSLAVEARRKKVEARLALGIAAKTIEIELSAEFGCTRRCIRLDIEAVRRVWAAEAADEGKSGVLRHQTRQMLRTIVRKAMSDKQYSAAVAGVSRLMELDGLKSPVEVKHGGELTIKDMTSDNKRKKLAELIQKAKAPMEQGLPN